MAPQHIFAKDIRALLEGGETRLELPPGTKLSPSAADLVREYGAQVVFVDPAEAEPQPSPEKRPGPPSTPAAQAATPDPAPDLSDQVREAVAEGGRAGISEAEVEEILNRVMTRLAAAKGEPGLAPDPAAETAAATATEIKAEPASDDDLVICRCEEITKGRIREAIATGMGTLNGIKRVTRAGMGLCQGQTCQRLVTQILCSELGLSPAEVEPTTARPPTRPIPLNLLATG